MRHAVITIAVLFAGGCAHTETSSMHTLGWRYLRLDTQCGVIEYDFRADNSVLLYNFCTDASITRPRNNESSDYFEPVFSIEHGIWYFESGELVLKFGNSLSRWKVTESKDSVSWAEVTYQKVNRISAIDSAENL